MPKIRITSEGVEHEHIPKGFREVAAVAARQPQAVAAGGGVVHPGRPARQPARSMGCSRQTQRLPLARAPPCGGEGADGLVPQYLYLPRITGDQVILDALVNPSAAVTGEATFYLADSFDAGTGRYQGLRPQQASSSQLPSLNSLIVKEEVAQAQSPETPPTPVASTGGGITVGSTGYQPETTSTPTTTGGGIAAPVQTPQPSRRTTFVASLKLDPMRAGLQMGDFLDEVMSHLQALPSAEVNLSVEVQVKVPDGIDDATARVVLENSRSLKVDSAQVY